MKSNMKEVQDYCNSLDEEHQCMLKAAIKQLRSNGASWEFINTGLSLKDKQNWLKYGYGLLFTQSFRAQIQTEILRRRNSIEDETLWVEDCSKSEQIQSIQEQKQSKPIDKNSKNLIKLTDNNLYNQIKKGGF